MMAAASLEATLDLWSSSPRDIKSRIGRDLALEQNFTVLVDYAYRGLLLRYVQSHIPLHHSCSPTA
jgi:hypothetical protein